MPKELEPAKLLSDSTVEEKSSIIELKDPTAGAKTEIISVEIEPVKEKFIALEEYSLPNGYGDNRIIIQVRDPYWIYAYWEITDHLKENISQKIGHETFSRSRPVLRVYDVTNNDLHDHQVSYFDIWISHGANNWYINVGKPNRSYIVDLGLLTEDNRFIVMLRSNKVHTPRDTFSDVIDEEWMIVEEEYHKLYRLSAGYGFGESSLELVESALERHRREMGSAAIQGISSPINWQEAKEVEHPFWLDIRTELIIYGATEPDATLTVKGSPITLRDDGTFTLRFALPDGENAISVKARSSHGDKEITITPIVKKWTINE